MAEIITVTKKTTKTTPKSLPSLSLYCKVAIDEAIVKITNRVIAVKSKIRKISPNGFITSTSLPKSNPAKLPSTIPPKSNRILL